MNIKDTLNKIELKGLVIPLLVFIVDLLIPLGVAVGVLYVCSIALLIRKEKKYILLVSVFVSFFILLVPILTYSHETTWVVLVNRIISIVAVWIVSYISIKHKDLDDKMKLYIQLENKNKELEQFTYIASHDLQEPLYTLTSFSELLKKDYAGKLDENANNCLEFISQASIRMSVLVKGLLDYSCIGQKKELAIVDCNKVVDAVLKDLNSVITESNAKIIVKKLPKVHAYETEIRLLFQNLISNAIKFSRKNIIPQLVISVREINNDWQFSVKDNGIGIDTRHQKRIFAIFKRLHAKNEYAGTGIGLAHCKKIVDLHYGKLWVESIPNKGSTFYFTISKQINKH